MKRQKRTSGPVLSIEQLKDGYLKSLVQAMALADSAQSILKGNAAIALGLAELAQEECGKSLSLLSAMALPATQAGFSWLWGDWLNHTRKAHRAFLYELICPIRCVMKLADDRILDGATLRATMTTEKEVGFYINYDHSKGAFIGPQESVLDVEAVHRLGVVLVILSTAHHLRDVLNGLPDNRGYSAFAPLALRICSEPLYQQDMCRLFDEYGRLSPDHAAIVTDLHSRGCGYPQGDTTGPMEHT